MTEALVVAVHYMSPLFIRDRTVIPVNLYAADPEVSRTSCAVQIRRCDPEQLASAFATCLR